MENVEELDVTQVGKEAIAERKAEKEGKPSKPAWELRLEKDHPGLVKEEVIEKKEVEQEEVKEVIEEKPVIEEQQDETKTEPETEEEVKPVEELSKPVEDKKDTAKEDAYIAEYAKKSGLSIVDAKEEVERNRAILAKYNNDPIEVAKAYRLTQSAFDKLKAQADQNKQSVDPVAAQIMANPKGYVEGLLKQNAAKLIEEFRQDNPARSAILDDDAILEELRDRGVAQITQKLQEHHQRMSSEASKKREEYIASVSELDRQFLPEIRDVLSKLPDHQIVSPSFKFEDLTRWARGNHVEKLVKDAEERGYKRGLEKAKILGEVGRATPSTKVKPKQESAISTSLTKYQQEQAKQMFGTAYDNENDMFKAYLEVTTRK